MEKKRRKIVKGKVENWKWKEGKLQNEERFFLFFIFCFSLFKTTRICFGSTKVDIFYREKSISRREKKEIRKNDFASSEKFSCYVPMPVIAPKRGQSVWIRQPRTPGFWHTTIQPWT